MQATASIGGWIDPEPVADHTSNAVELQKPDFRAAATVFITEALTLRHYELYDLPQGELFSSSELATFVWMIRKGLPAQSTEPHVGSQEIYEKVIESLLDLLNEASATYCHNMTISIASTKKVRGTIRYCAPYVSFERVINE